VFGSDAGHRRRGWTFADAKQSEKLWGPRGYRRYPAKFIPLLVHRLITSYSTLGASVGDPFLNSATTGVEALRLERSLLWF
jgi:DNA modification methylase